MGFLGGASGKEPACQRRRRKRYGFNPWVGKIPQRRIWQPTPVLFPRESHGQRSWVSYSPEGHKESDMTEATCTLSVWFLGLLTGSLVQSPPNAQSQWSLEKCIWRMTSAFCFVPIFLFHWCWCAPPVWKAIKSTLFFSGKAYIPALTWRLS